MCCRMPRMPVRRLPFISLPKRERCRRCRLPAREQVRRFATRLRDLGVVPGDRVVAYLPNVPECAVAMLATTAIGAIWSSAAIDFGVRTVVDRFQQIAPKVLIAADGYHFGGKVFDRRREVAEIARRCRRCRRSSGCQTWQVRFRSKRRRCRARCTHGTRCSPAPTCRPIRSASSGSAPIIRCGSCSRRVPRACPRRSCIVMRASWPST